MEYFTVVALDIAGSDRVPRPLSSMKKLVASAIGIIKCRATVE
jgi:hypothetical protein